MVEWEGAWIGIEIDDVVAVEKTQGPFLSGYRSNVRCDYGSVFRQSGIMRLQHEDAGARAAAIIADRIEEADVLEFVTFLDFRNGGIGKSEFHDLIPFFPYKVTANDQAGKLPIQLCFLTISIRYIHQKTRKALFRRKSG